MKIAFTTLGCPGMPLEEIARKAPAWGFEGIELRTADDGEHISPQIPLAEAERIGALFRAAGAPVMSILGYARFAHTKPAEIEKNQALLRRNLELAKAMQAPFIRAYAGQLPKGADISDMAGRIAEAVKPVAQEAAAQGVKICLETHDDWCAGANIMRVVDAVGSPGLGVLFDIFNAFLQSGESWLETYGKVRDHIGYCHVKDGYRDRDGKIVYVMLGAGELPIADIVSRFKADGFKGYMSLEWEKKWHPELEPPERVFPQYPIKLKSLIAAG